LAFSSNSFPFGSSSRSNACREELLGIPRPGNPADVDWSKEVPTLSSAATTLPPPVQISLSELLNKVTTKRPGFSPVTQPASSSGDSGNAKVVCYYASWSARRPGLGRFSPEDVNPTMCTHLVYAFGSLKDNRLSLADDESEESSDLDVNVYSRLQSLRDKNPELKIILAIGGWAFGSAPFKELTSNVFRMNQFVYDSTEFLRSNNFDGLDIDWEYPRYAALLPTFLEFLERTQKTSYHES
jgi:chitinase